MRGLRPPQTDGPGRSAIPGNDMFASGRSSSAIGPRRLRPVHWLIACGLLLAVAVIAGTAAMLADLRGRVLTASQRELRNTAVILAEQTDRAFQAVDLMQSGLIERLYALGVKSSDDLERIMSGHAVHQMLKEKVGGWPHIVSITLINAQGKLFNFSRFWPLPDIDVTDREFYRALKADPSLTSFMGEPVRNRATGSWTIHPVRKVAGPNGEFLGLVLGAMEMSYFDRFFSTVVLGGGGRIRLFRNDGVMLASHPPVDPSAARVLANKQRFAELSEQTKAGTVELVRPVAGEKRQIVIEKLGHYPLLLTASRTVDDALAQWRGAAIYISSAAGLLLIVIAAIVVLGIRQLKSYETLV